MTDRAEPEPGFGGGEHGPRLTTEGSDVEQLREEIRQTRAELGETVEILTARVDVKARAEDAAHSAASSVVYKAGRVRERLVRSPVRTALIGAAVAAGLAGLVTVLIRRRTRSRNWAG